MQTSRSTTSTEHSWNPTAARSWTSSVPTTAQVIGHVRPAMGRMRAIAAAKRAFATFGRSIKEERTKILCRLHEAVSARIDDMRSWRADLENGKAPAHSCPGYFEG